MCTYHREKSDPMKQLQDGFQQKLVNDFKMILLCFSISSFIQHGREMFLLKFFAALELLG